MARVIFRRSESLTNSTARFSTHYYFLVVTPPDFFHFLREKVHNMPFPHAILGENNSLQVLDNTPELYSQSESWCAGSSIPSAMSLRHPSTKIFVVLAENFATTPKR